MSESVPLFPETRWSLIVNARDCGDDREADALDTLCRTYWPPLYVFARRWGAGPDDAPDLVQEFLARLIHRGDMVRPSPEMGRFRSFLLRAFQNHLVSEHRHRTAEKRGGKVSFISLEDINAEEERSLSVCGSPERAYDLRWAEETMRRAMCRVEADYHRSGGSAVFQAARPALMGEKAEDMATMGSRLGLSAGAAGSAVFRMRGKFREALREEISQTVADKTEVDNEIRYLLTLLAQ